MTMKEYWFAVLLFIIKILVNAEIEICSDGGQNVYQLTAESCPAGVLFMEPQTADCIATSGEKDVKEDICTNEEYDPENKQFQFFPEIAADKVPLNESCKTINPTMCTLPSLRINASSFLGRVRDVNFTFDSAPGDNKTGFVAAQTQRMFQYMMGLGKLEIDESLRVVMLLKKSFIIAQKFTPSRYLPTVFWEDVQTAFLFLFQEGDSTRVQDVSNEEFETIMDHLKDCLSQKRSLFVWEGLKCATYSVIQRVRKQGQLFNNFANDNKDAYSKYDVVVEATWGAIDFVHGLCYGTFRTHINSHHLYERAMERLFTKEILYRWENPHAFQSQDIWSHFVSANVKNALMNMDICIQASYLATPFFHRLERPIDGVKVSRKRRWAETHSLRSFDSIEGYCFKSQDEAEEVLREVMALCIYKRN